MGWKRLAWVGAMGIAVTDEEAAAWKKEIEEYDRQLEFIGRLRDAKFKMLEAFNLIHNGKQSPIEPGFEADPTQLSLADAIGAVLRKADRPMRPQEIKKFLPTIGYTQTFAKNYLHTAIGRAVEKDLIEKIDGRRYRAKSAAPRNGIEHNGSLIESH